MTAWLIVNEYLNTEKFIEIRELFLEAARAKGIILYVHTNAEFTILCSSLGKQLVYNFENEDSPEFVIFYDKDIELGRAMVDAGFDVYNDPLAIDFCDDKFLTSFTVETFNKNCRGKLRMPKTFKVPFSYDNIGIKKEASFKFLEYIEAEITYPIVIKHNKSSFGMGVCLAKNREEAVNVLCEMGNRPCIIQEYIASAEGTDVRLQMVGDECVAAMRRSNDSDFRSNLTNGGHMSEYAPDEKVLKLAKGAMNLLRDSIGLHFAGLDIMFDKNGDPVLCEVNSNAHFKNLYDLTGINVAENIIEYLISKCGQ